MTEQASAPHRRKWMLTIAAIALPLALAVFLAIFLRDQQRPEQQAVKGEASSSAYQHALLAYQQQNYAAAAGFLQGQWATVIKAEEGCHLLISVYALAKDWPQLEAASRLCLQEGLAPGIAHEGFAYSMSAQGKFHEALELLGQEKKSLQNSRLYIALARLHLMVGQDQEAAALFLQAISEDEIWSVWLSSALKQPLLAANKDFIRQLVGEVLKKEKQVPIVEQLLLTQARALGLEQEEQRLAERLTKVSPYDPA